MFRVTDICVLSVGILMKLGTQTIVMLVDDAEEVFKVKGQRSSS